MSTIEFLFNSENYLFTSAIILMLFIAILEGLMTVIGIGLSELLDPLIPDFDADINYNVENNSFALSKFFSWIRLKQVPILMLFVIFLTFFGLTGLFLQAILFTVTSVFWSLWLLIIPSFIVGLFSMRIVGSWISKVLPKDETSSLSNEDLIGHMAVIVLGKAKKGSPAEGKVVDKYGQSHYLMLEPEEENILFNQGEKVLLIKKEETYYLATNDIPENLK